MLPNRAKHHKCISVGFKLKHVNLQIFEKCFRRSVKPGLSEIERESYRKLPIFKLHVFFREISFQKQSFTMRSIPVLIFLNDIAPPNGSVVGTKKVGKEYNFNGITIRYAMHLFRMWFPLSWPRASVLRLVWTSMEDHSGVILPKITRFIPYATYWKTPLVSSLQLKCVCYHRSRRKNICQGVWKFGIISKWKIMYGTMVKILETWKSPHVKACYLIQRLDLLLKGCICHNILAITFFFHNLTCWRHESLKKKCPIGNYIFVPYGTPNF